MFTLSEVAQKFAQLDALPEDRVPALEKALRNLTQRSYLPPATVNGRVFMYDWLSLIAMRVSYFATETGADRLLVERLQHWMQKPRDHRGSTILAEASERALNGETFSFHIIVHRNGDVHCEFDWAVDKDYVRQAVTDMLRQKGEFGRISLPASEIICELSAVR